MGEFDNDAGPVEGSKTSASTLPCGQCGAELEFKPGTTVLKCQYCGHSQTIEIKAGAAVIEYDLNDAIARYLGHAGHMVQQGNRNVKCEDCGAEIMVGTGAQTVRCDYCGGKRIIDEELPAGVLQPESLLPFTFDSANAVERFRKWLKGGDGFFGKLWVKLVRPGALQQRANVQELHGIYVPFWTYDSKANSNWTAQAGYYYYVTESYTNSQGKRSTRQVRKIRWVWTSGRRNDFFNDWLVCASRQYYQPRLQKLMKAIEPFPTQGLTPYDTKYLAGFRAERYSLDLKAGWEVARDGMQAELYARCGRDVPGDTHRFLEVRTTYFGQSFKHVLLPVYTMGYQFNDKPYNVLVNGCTGEVQGEAPLSWIKLTILIAAILLVIGGGIGAYFIWGQPSHKQTQQPGPNDRPVSGSSSSSTPYSHSMSVEATRDGVMQVWTIEFQYTGKDEAERKQNRDEFEKQLMEREVSALAATGIAEATDPDPAALSRQLQEAFNWNFTLPDGRPRFSSVRVTK